MGESTAIVHAILTIVGVILASIFAAYVIGRMGYVNSVLSNVINSKLEELQTNIKIVAGFYNQTQGEYVIYVKNVGGIEISETDLYNRSEVYIGPYNGYPRMFLISNVTSSTTASIVDLDGNKVWSPGETIVIKVPYNTTGLGAVEVKVVLPSGAYAEEVLPG